MKVEATVCYPVHVTIEIPDYTLKAEIHEKLLHEANKLHQSSTIKPVIIKQTNWYEIK